MNAKYTEILNMKSQDCTDWLNMCAEKLFGIQVPIRDRKEYDLSKLTKPQINKVIEEDLCDFGWDKIDEEPKEKDAVSIDLFGFMQLGFMVDDNTVAMRHKLYPVKRLKLTGVFRKTREPKHWRSVEEILNIK